MDSELVVRSSKQLSSLYKHTFLCPSCSTWRLSQKQKPSFLRSALFRNRRNVSTLRSTTAINASKPVPPHLKPLYAALTNVRKNAAQYVNTSRLQLALQGLETKHPTIRIAVLGLNVPDTARRVARLLLADPLEDEGQWESQLAGEYGDYARGLVIRYGSRNESNISQPKHSVPILYVPAAVLERYNLEILVSAVNSPTNSQQLQPAITPVDVFLSPAVGTPTSSEGRQTIISQPVHKTLLIAQGLDEIVTVTQLLASAKFGSIEDRDSIQTAVNLQAANIQDREHSPYVIDAKAAEEGLSAIRTSVTQATTYEHKWMASGMTELTQWIRHVTDSGATHSKTLSQPIQSLISAVLDIASLNIEAAQISSQQTAKGHSMSPSDQISLDKALEEFSRSSHQELQSGLASAWSSRNWRKLAWYKLFWRVDDVGLIITDLVNGAWLPKTERAVYELSGRLIQAGINPVTLSPPDLDIEDPASLETNIQPVAQSILEPQLIPQTSANASIAYAPASTSTPTPPTTSASGPSHSPAKAPLSLTTTISALRQNYIQQQTTALTAEAQQLVLRTLSITGLTGGLTLLTTTVTNLYEASTILAVGVTYALWKMQSGWLHATRAFEQGLFAQGRDAIRDLTENIRQLIEVKKRVELDPGVQRSLDAAQGAVAQARQELHKLRSDA